MCAVCSARHWCDVVEHAGIESPRWARWLSDLWLSIKADREERPDLDQSCMQAVHAMTGRGGWPMSVFLTHDLKPFYGGTYWPPTGRMGMPGFDQILSAVGEAWQQRRSSVLDQAETLTDHLRFASNLSESSGPLSHDLTQHAVSALER